MDKILALKDRLFNKVSKPSLKGFTLPELLIAVMILAFVIAGILQVFITCALLDRANRNKSIAMAHAEFVMEDIMEYARVNELSTIDLNSWNWNSATIGNRLGCPSPYAYPCILNSETIVAAATGSSNPLGVIITVSWKDRHNSNTRHLELETLISKR